MAGMDQMAGMAMAPDIGTCKVSMLWNWETIDACFLSESWQIKSRGGFAGLCIGVILLAILLEMLRRTAKTYDRHLIRQRQKTVTFATTASNNAPETADGSLIAKCDHAAIPTAAFRPNIPQQIVRALLHTLQFALAYWMMLLAMYYNGYIIICMIIGAFIGSFIFQWERIGPRSQGCWTCRLRRKKCDERRPVCSICDALEISCHYSDKKPEWMDGGRREKQMADGLKAMVKSKASERRERRWAQDVPASELDVDVVAPQTRGRQHLQPPRDVDRGLSRGLAQKAVLDSSADRDTNGSSSSEATPMSVLSSQNDAAATTTNVTLHTSTLGSPATSQTGTEPISLEKTMAIRSLATFPGEKSENEITFIMIYLDYVVPFLFPFYRPCLLEASRGWMLVVLMKNKALFHTALSLASYFYSVILDSAHGNHNACKKANWGELQIQQELSIRALQRDMSNLNARGVASAFDESVRCLESIIQMLEFEVAIANTENWQVHFDAATVLFSQLLANHATDSEKPWYSILRKLGVPNLESTFGQQRHPWSCDQSAYRFYTAHLLWVDIIAATATASPPKLRGYHEELLQGEAPLLRLEEYVGCYNWAILLIGEIAALDAWKKDRRASNSLDTVELTKRGESVGSKLREGISNLDAVPMENMHAIFDPSAQAPHLPVSGLGVEVLANSEFHARASLALHTKIWAQAAMTYLATVISGLQPENPCIQAGVQATIALFSIMPSPLCLRTLVWPFAVTGCLAQPEQEQFFLGLVNDIGAMQVFGTIKEALGIMQSVWGHRQNGCIDPETWDMAACFNVLGHRALPV
ncbi:fungal-specific transcription factor domain-containing protein [Whalleya microplaca]|nr:fungal-specific transcription factor domain-containing protein [Whalleya microplaca]